MPQRSCYGGRRVEVDADMAEMHDAGLADARRRRVRDEAGCPTRPGRATAPQPWGLPRPADLREGLRNGRTRCYRSSPKGKARLYRVCSPCLLQAITTGTTAMTTVLPQRCHTRRTHPHRPRATTMIEMMSLHRTSRQHNKHSGRERLFVVFASLVFLFLCISIRPCMETKHLSIHPYTCININQLSTP